MPYLFRSLFSIIIIWLYFFIPVRAEDEKNQQIINGLITGNQASVDESLSYIKTNKPLEILPSLKNIILTNKDADKKDIALKAFMYYPFKSTIEYCLDILKNTRSFPVKKEIIGYLSESGDRRAVPLIISELSSPFFAVRESAVLALKKIGDDRMFPYVINMMENQNPIYKIYALEAIYHLYDLRFFDHLVNMLNDENKSVRYYTLKCIEANELKKALVRVRKTALSDESWEVRVRAVQVLEKLADGESLYTLLKCLIDANREIRYYSARALRTLQFRTSANPISDALYSETDDEIKIIIIDTLIAVNNAGGYGGLKRVISEDGNYRIRIHSAYALGIIKKKYSETLLLESIADKSMEVRAEICNSLGFYKSRQVISTLLDVVNDDPERYVRSAALFSIRRLGGSFAILPLYDRYAVEIDPVFKEQIRRVLRKLIEESA